MVQAVMHNAVEPQRPALTSLRERHVLVIGLGRFGGGVGVTRWLAAQGARVRVTDQADEAALASSIRSLDGVPVEFRLGRHELCDLEDIDLVVVNPAVDKRRSPLFREVIRKGIPWTTEMNLFCARCPAPVIGVTGSFGKSTTAAMITTVLKKAITAGATEFTDVHLGGNIGRSLLNDLSTIRPTDIVVLEMSNAQLEDLPFIGWTPAVAVMTNIEPHHLDRYDGFEEYVAAKLNILAPLHAVPQPPVAPSPFGDATGDPVNGVLQHLIVGDLPAPVRAWLSKRTNEAVHHIIRAAEIDAPSLALRVPGEHNQANARLAYLTCRLLHVPDPVVRSGLHDFAGLPHRLAFVARLNDVDYINDSKSTSPAAVVASIRALGERPIIAIVGGQRKDGVYYEECARLLAGRCRAVVCMGQCGPELAETLRRAASEAECAIYAVATLDEAVARARALARSGDVVLFSPGAPSFDAYANFAERGDHFVRLIAGGV